MTPDVVVDVGNTRIKWGRCREDRVVAMAGLPPDDPPAWREQVRHWSLPPGATWILSGVHPARREKLADWLNQERFTVQTLDWFQQLPLRVQVDYPEKVGLDRLLNAVAANSRRQAGQSAVIVDAGSAVTLDLLDSAGVFRGGAIFPGLRLMAQALHGHTAQLPRVEVNEPASFPGTSTEKAMRVGILNAVAGGIEKLLGQARKGVEKCNLFLTGGDGPLLAAVLEGGPVLWPEMTLEGIRLTSSGA